MAGDDAVDVGESGAGALKLGRGVEARKAAKKFIGGVGVEADAVVADGNYLFGWMGSVGVVTMVMCGRGLFRAYLTALSRRLAQT